MWSAKIGISLIFDFFSEQAYIYTSMGINSCINRYKFMHMNIIRRRWKTASQIVLRPPGLNNGVRYLLWFGLDGTVKVAEEEKDGLSYLITEFLKSKVKRQQNNIVFNWVDSFCLLVFYCVAVLMHEISIFLADSRRKCLKVWKFRILCIELYFVLEKLLPLCLTLS